tara:strand:- start:12715 stop:13737 length:1023 start_codon:yes stop_codon:yes gene_type:complete
MANHPNPDKKRSPQKISMTQASKKNVPTWNLLFLKKWFKSQVNIHKVSFTLGFKNIAQTPIATLMTLLAIGIALSLPIGLHTFLKNIQSLASDFEYRGTLTLYLDKDITSVEASYLASSLKNTYDAIENTEYVDAETALAEFKQQADVEDILKLLPENPLNPMIVLKLDTNKVTYAQAKNINAAIQTHPQVTSADLDYEWVEKLYAFIKLGKTLVNSLALLIGLGVIFIIGNTIRMALTQHQKELEVLNLLGATPAFIRRPFLYRGIFYGGLGALMATCIISIATWFFKQPVIELAYLYDGMVAIQALKITEIVSIFIYCCFLGGLGAYIAFYQQQKSVS